jgi:hypothetical protein
LHVPAGSWSPWLRTVLLRGKKLIGASWGSRDGWGLFLANQSSLSSTPKYPNPRRWRFFEALSSANLGCSPSSCQGKSLQIVVFKDFKHLGDLKQGTVHYLYLMKTQMLNAWVTFGNIHAYVQGQSGRQKKLVEAAGRHHE